MNGTTLSVRRIFPFSGARKERLKQQFERVAVPLLSEVYTAAWYFTRNEAEADDLVQETYYRAFRFFDKFEPGTNCKAWLLSILRNLFINRYRKKNVNRKVDWDKVDQAYEGLVLQREDLDKDNPENLLFARVMDYEIEEALKQLPEEFRTAILLVDIEELTYEEAAKVMECAVGTVRSRLSRGRRLLQVALREYAIERGIIKE